MGALRSSLPAWVPRWDYAVQGHTSCFVSVSRTGWVVTAKTSHSNEYAPTNMISSLSNFWTGNHAYVWTNLDMGREHLVAAVSLQSRMNCFQDRQKGIQARVGSTDIGDHPGTLIADNTLCGESDDSGSEPQLLIWFK